MYIGDSEFKGEAPGPFVGLDLTEELYIGAVPDFSRIARAAGYANGFTGQRATWLYLVKLLVDSLGGYQNITSDRILSHHGLVVVY